MAQLCRIRSCKPPTIYMYFDNFLSQPLSKIKKDIGKSPPSCKPPSTSFVHMSAKPPQAAYKSEYGIACV